ncbi:effector-associated domain EAD1-containing protein [Actinoplanes sp. NPDC048796]|uniref:effector-associated domain EAD1-containing protein n=1 Tax=unclassified Actinoplanes TaxID=2626549 RepID=UPI0033CC02F3
MTGRQLRGLSDALLDAYPNRDGFEQLLEFDLERSLNRMVGNVNMTDTVFAVLLAARSQGWLAALVDAAREDRPGNPVLRQWITEVDWRSEPAPAAIPDHFERTIRPHAPELQPRAWHQRWAELEARTCRIDAETAGGYAPFGTGFLVGPGLCLTAGHVIEEAKIKGHEPDALRLRFPGGQMFRPDADPVAASSPRSPVDELADPGGRLPDPGHLDFALLRIAGRPGDSRGWISDVRERVLEPYDELAILHHLDGEDQTLAFGSTIGLNGNGTRLRHTVNTAHGSSGAPLFDISLKLVAVHQSGDPDKRVNHLPTHNLAVPALALLRALPAELGAFRTP